MRRSLTRQERLRNGRDIKSLFKTARRAEAGGLKLLFRRNGTAVNRMAVVVAKGCRGAVRRNREKRITREAYRSLKEHLRVGFDLLFVVAGLGASFSERRATMEGILSATGLCHKADKRMQ